MKTLISNIDELTTVAAEHFLHVHKMQAGTVTKYQHEWERLKRFMKDHELKHYSTAVATRYLKHRHGDFIYDTLSLYKKNCLRYINALTDFQELGFVPVRRKSAPSLSGSIGEVMQALVARQNEQGLSPKTISHYKLYLSRFLEYISDIGITEICDLNHTHIIAFIKGYGSSGSAIMHNMLRVIRNFFRFAYEKQMIPVDYSVKVPQSNLVRQPGLPSVYTPDEVGAMLNVIDRGNPIGKRDYAIILLAARLGLRSSDIINLKFEHIHWEQCRIVIEQYKTGKVIELPLTDEIGEALIDHLKFGRPVSNLSYVFLVWTPPYGKLSNTTLSTAVQRYLKLAGIDYSNRKRGMHTLRHSLAANMLQQKVPLPVISEVLGHKRTESTMYYLRIDITSLRQCALSVMPVASDFYIRVSQYNAR